MFTSVLASLRLLAQIFAQAKSLYAFYEANKNEKWFQDSSKTFEELTKPNATVEEKKKAVSDLAKLWGNI